MWSAKAALAVNTANMTFIAQFLLVVQWARCAMNADRTGYVEADIGADSKKTERRRKT